MSRVLVGQRSPLNQRLDYRRLEMILCSIAGWKPLNNELDECYMRRLDAFLEDERASGVDVYPRKKSIFRAFELTKLSDVKVVILGQDPYFRKRQATGLAFGVPKGEELPPSLRNIYRELEANGYPRPTNGDLTAWASQGVLLLNCILTVRAGEPKSHRKNGWWTRFTRRVIEIVDEKRPDVIFCLWGREAQHKEGLLVHSKRDHILKSSHPSPKSAHREFRNCPSFLGCGHFSRVNCLLKAQGDKEICW